jgi:hypothetical protein
MSGPTTPRGADRVLILQMLSKRIGRNELVVTGMTNFGVRA